MPSLLDKVKSAIPSRGNLLDKLVAAKRVTAREAKELTAIKAAWNSGECTAGSHSVYAIVAEEIAAISETPKTTFMSWLGKKG
jgi:hypothetical protein